MDKEKYKGKFSFVCIQSSGSKNAFYWLPNHLLSCRYHMTSINKHNGIDNTSTQSLIKVENHELSVVNIPTEYRLSFDLHNKVF